MLEAVSWFIIAIITHLLDCYVFSKMLKEKFKINIFIIFIIVAFSFIDCFFSLINIISKVVMSNIVTFIILELVYKKSLSRTIIGTVFTYLGYVVADIIFSLIFILLLNVDSQYYIDNIYGLIFANLFDFVIYIIFFNLKKVINILSKVMNWYDEKKNINLIINTILIMIICYVVLYPLSFNKIFLNYQLLVLCIFLGIMVFVIGYFKEKSNNNKLTVEYTQLLEYVKDYENEVVEKGKRQHEYKNQLVVINGMIPKTNKKLKKYVEDKLEIEENTKDNIWLEKLTNLPSGGIKGLIYYKLKKMIENNIDVYVEVDEELSDEKKWFNVDKNLEDYTRILGVYLDNAIEASLETKDKYIVIEFKDNSDNIEFTLSNTYKGDINYKNIDKEKYSTKGKGRGYGLSLVKDIIERNKLINQKRELNGKFYVQKLTIKK